MNFQKRSIVYCCTRGTRSPIPFFIGFFTVPTIAVASVSSVISATITDLSVVPPARVELAQPLLVKGF